MYYFIYIGLSKKFVDRCNRINPMKSAYKIYKEHKTTKMLEILTCNTDNFPD